MEAVDSEDRKIAKKGASDEEKEAGRVEKRRLVGQGSWQWFEMTPYEVRSVCRMMNGRLMRKCRSDARKSGRGFLLGHSGGRLREARTQKGCQR